MAALEGHHEVLVVGTGFAGLYALYILKQQGLDVVAIETGSDVGGTWHWNRYPGARSDVNTHAYQLSFDKDIWQDFTGPNNYFFQPELQRYFQTIAKKHDLYSLISFNTRLTAAHFDDKENVWRLTTNTGKDFTVRYLVTALGILHKPYIPEIPGRDKFKGQIVHSSGWSPDIQFKGKRIGVIGTGASGVQIVSALAETAGTLTHFIRHAQYVLPAQYRLRGTEEKTNINRDYEKIWSQIFDSAVGFGFDEPQRKTFDVSAEERERIYQDLWDAGSGFRFLFGGFSDIAVDPEANKEAIKFIHKKIRGIVKDPQKAEILSSKDWFARRPLTDDNYYSRFNQDNVLAVDILKNPITEYVAEGIKTADGKVHPLDLLVFATGFDSVDGSYDAIDFKGRNGLPLKEKWHDYPRTSYGITTSKFPNLFFINGPGVPFSNQPPTCEAAANFAAELINRAEEIRKRGHGSGVVESSAEADEAWTNACGDIAGKTLFSKTPSWFFGENIPGRTVHPRFWFGGIKEWRNAINKSKNDGFAGFDFGVPSNESKDLDANIPHSNLGKQWAS